MQKREFWVIAWSGDDAAPPIALHYPTYKTAERQAKKLVLGDYKEAMVCSEIAHVERAIGVSKFQ